MFGAILGAGSSAMGQHRRMQQAMQGAQQQQERAQEAMQRRDVQDWRAACALKHKMRQRDGVGKVERVQGRFRYAIEASTRIPQHPKQDVSQ